MSAAPIALFIGHVFPEPVSSAAGWRTLALVRDFQAAGYTVVFGAPSDANGFSRALESQEVSTRTVRPNDPAFDTWIAELRPAVAVLDRFMIEEQFGWRIREHSPETVQILDTIDLHFVRRGRGDWLERARKFGVPGAEGQATAEIFADSAAVRSHCLESEDALREVASLHRADLSLLISPRETELLRASFAIPEEKLLTLPFSYTVPPAPSAAERAHFATIGNFRHGPNLDGVRWLVREIWPRIRAELPTAELHLYGAYPPKEVMDLRVPGVKALGACENAVQTLARYRAVLAPLRFGAGMKGKIADAWAARVPVITTPIGSEGMNLPDGAFAGLIAQDAETFARESVRVHTDAALAAELAERGVNSLESLFDPGAQARALIERVERIRVDLPAHRARDFTGRMLAHHTLKSTVYFSRWIELKETLKKSELAKESP